MAYPRGKSHPNRKAERNQEILRLYTGDDGQEPLSFAEIGEMFGLSRERVRQIIRDETLREVRRVTA